MSGANRARAGHKPAAGPAVPAGDGRPGREQGQGAARPVQHPHRRTGRQLMNSHRGAELVTVYQWTNGSYEGPGAASVTSREDVMIHELVENKKFLVLLLFFAPPSYPVGCIFTFFVWATCNQTSYLKTVDSWKLDSALGFPERKPGYIFILENK